MSSERVSIVQEEKEIQEVFKHEVDDSSEECPMEEWSSLIFEIPEENPKRILYAEGLYSPGSGELCTKYIPLSSSSVYRHPYYNYPSIKDPGIQEALLGPIPPIIYSDDGQDLFIDLCKEMRLCPIRSFHRQLLEDKVDLQYYGINPAAFRAIAMSLRLNKYVKVLNLTDNFIENDGCYHLGEMFTINFTIQELILSGCRIGPSGIQRLCYSIQLNKTLRKLDLSKNQLGDEGVEFLAMAIFRGLELTDLNLSYNNLTGASTGILAEVLETTNTFKKLNMSWNKFLNAETVVTLCKRLNENPTFEELDLSWNSLTGPRIGVAIKILLKNANVRKIILNNNKLSDRAIKFLSQNLPQAKRLMLLDLSFNPMSPNDALELLQWLTNPEVKMQQLRLDNVIVTQEFMNLRQEILSMKNRKNTVITYGYVKVPIVPKGADMRDLVLSRADAICRKVKKKEIDFALVVLQMYKKNSDPIDFRYFQRNFKYEGVILDEDLVDMIANLFLGPKLGKNKTINLAGLVDFLKRKWPERQLPPTPPEPEPEPKKKGKKKKGQKKK